MQKQFRFVVLSLLLFGASSHPTVTQDTISLSFVGFGDDAIMFSISEYIESYSDCKRANQKFNDKLARAREVLQQCKQAPEAGLGNRRLVTVCSRQTYTGWPQCVQRAQDICRIEQARSEFAVKCRNAVAKVLADAQTRAEAEAQRRADAGPAKALDFASDATNNLNDRRPEISPAHTLSKKLTSMGLRYIQRQGMQNFALMNRAFRDLDNSYSTSNPTPTAEALTPPNGFTKWNDLSKQVLEKDYDLLFGNHFASEERIRELMPELAARAALGEIDLSGSVSIDEVVALLQSERKEEKPENDASGTGSGSSLNAEVLAGRMRETLAALERASRQTPAPTNNQSSPQSSSSNSSRQPTNGPVFSNFINCDKAKDLQDAGKLSNIRSHLSFVSDRRWQSCVSHLQAWEVLCNGEYTGNCP